MRISIFDFRESSVMYVERLKPHTSVFLEIVERRASRESDHYAMFARSTEHIDCKKAQRSPVWGNRSKHMMTW